MSSSATDLAKELKENTNLTFIYYYCLWIRQREKGAAVGAQGETAVCGTYLFFHSRLQNEWENKIASNLLNDGKHTVEVSSQTVTALISNNIHTHIHTHKTNKQQLPYSHSLFTGNSTADQKQNNCQVALPWHKMLHLFGDVAFAES